MVLLMSLGSWRLMMWGSLNLIAPYIGVCFRLNKTFGCPSNPTVYETAWWLGVTGILWTAALAAQDREWWAGNPT